MPSASRPRNLGGLNLEPWQRPVLSEHTAGQGTDSDFIEMGITPVETSSELSQVGVFGSIDGGGLAS